LVISLAAMGGVLFGLIHGMTEGSHALTWPMFVLIWPVTFLTIGSIASFQESDPEKQVEKELQECMKKYSEG